MQGVGTFYHIPVPFRIKSSMNAIFAVVTIAAAAFFLVKDPNGFLPAMLSGGEKAALLSFNLLAVYCAWLGFFKILEKCGVAEKIARLFAPIARKIFHTDDKEAIYLAGSNLSANMLGLPGAPTPLGIKATKKFLGSGNDRAADLLFVLNATSLQLLPTTVIALRISEGSQNPMDILLPTLLATLISTLAGAILLKIAHRFRRKK